MHVGQTAVDAIVAEGQPRVVDAQQVQDRGVDVVHQRGVSAIERLIAPLVALAMRYATTDAAASAPDGARRRPWGPPMDYRDNRQNNNQLGSILHADRGSTLRAG